MPMNREILQFFPALQGAHITIEVSSDFLPGIEVLSLRRARRRARLRRQEVTHRVSGWRTNLAGILPLSRATFNRPDSHATKCDIPRHPAIVVPCRLRDFQTPPTVPQSISHPGNDFNFEEKLQ